MKKIASFAAAIVLAAMTTSVSAFAADSVTVNVTINTGKDSIMLIRDNVDVTDIDSDGKLTINDALYCAHFYPPSLSYSTFLVGNAHSIAHTSSECQPS